MAKLDALKEKIAGLKLKLTEKLQSIPFLQKLLAKKEVKESPPSDYAMGRIYRSGGVFTRLQVILFFCLAIAAAASVGFVAKRLSAKLHVNDENKKLVADYSHGIEDLKKRMEEKASVLSLGKFLISSYVGIEKPVSMAIDIWIRVDGIEAANYVQSHEVVLRDKTMDALNELYVQKVNLLTDPGKEFGKKKIITFLNQVIPAGRVEEVFFHNIVVQ